MNTSGDEELARRLQREEEERASGQHGAAASPAGPGPGQQHSGFGQPPSGHGGFGSASAASSHWHNQNHGAAAAAASCSNSSSSAAIAILQRQVSEVLAGGPNMDIRLLFRLYNAALFGNALDSVSVDWSSRMKLCAGQCSFKPLDGYCRIALRSANTAFDI